jgi:hypothetical protein
VRKPEYISPSSLATWRRNPEEYYIRYLCDERLPRFPQTDPMAVGSSFDAYVKSHLYSILVGKPNAKYEFQALFEAQVEPHARTKALEAGKHVFDNYKRTGALAELLTAMKGSLGEPRFEFEIQSVIGHKGREVWFLGRPDVFFINHLSGHVILDFKVNGYYSRSAQSPKPGYVRILPGGHVHPNCVGNIKEHYGIKINSGIQLEDIDIDWAAQLSIYSWLCGCDVGSDWVAAIDQIVCKPCWTGYPELRFAQHRCLVGVDFQRKLFNEAADLWDVITSGWVFRDMTEQDSRGRCELLDATVKELKSNSSDNQDFLALIKQQFGFN